MSLLVAVEDWITDRGHEVDVEQEDLNRALDYLQSLPWALGKEPDWEDHTIWDAAILSALATATLMEVQSPGVLMPTTAQRVRSESVDVIRIEYESGGNQQTFPALQRFLRGYVQGGNVITVRLA